MKTVKKMGHQGDVFFRKLSDNVNDINKFLSADFEQKNVDDQQALTVLEGEATHHHHQFRDMPNVQLFVNLNIEEGIQKMIAVVTKPSELMHYHVKDLRPTKEHDTILFPPGIYEFRTQRESRNSVLSRVTD